MNFNIENSVEASTCAFKSQDIKGQSGIFTEKPKTNKLQHRYLQHKVQKVKIVATMVASDEKI